MSKLAGSVFLLLILSLPGFSQAPKSVAPVKWERYAIPGQQATVLLPKLPVVMNTGSTCRGEKRSDYAAYADGAAYVLAVVSEADPPNLCPERKVFDEENFAGGVAAVRSTTYGGDVKTSDVEINGRKWKRIRGRNIVHMLYNDFERKRWFEISISSREAEKIEENDIFASLNFDQNIKGIPVGAGSKSMLGDAHTKEKPVLVPAAPRVLPFPGTPAYGRMGGAEGPRLKSSENDFKGEMIAMKPRPEYTERARKAGINGTVSLKVAFLNNGSIGKISVVGKLPHGLTEASIAAARKILFVPAKKDKAAVSVTRDVEYYFNIY
jgi:TonB family protein